MADHREMLTMRTWISMQPCTVGRQVRGQVRACRPNTVTTIMLYIETVGERDVVQKRKGAVPQL